MKTRGGKRFQSDQRQVYLKPILKTRFFVSKRLVPIQSIRDNEKIGGISHYIGKSIRKCKDLRKEERNIKKKKKYEINIQNHVQMHLSLVSW
jgi:hypothetical protein